MTSERLAAARAATAAAKAEVAASAKAMEAAARGAEEAKAAARAAREAAERSAVEAAEIEMAIKLSDYIGGGLEIKTAGCAGSRIAPGGCQNSPNPVAGRLGVVYARALKGDEDD